MRENGGHAVALHWSMRNLYGINPGEVTKHFQSSISFSSLSDYDLYIHVYTIFFFFQVWWAASDLGWVVGHSYIVYAPLLSGCTTVLFEVNVMQEIADISLLLNLT